MAHDNRTRVYHGNGSRERMPVIAWQVQAAWLQGCVWMAIWMASLLCYVSHCRRLLSKLFTWTLRRHTMVSFALYMAGVWVQDCWQLHACISVETTESG